MTRVVIHDDAIRRLFYDPAGPVGRKLITHAYGIEQRAKAKAPRRSGALADSIHSRPVALGGTAEPGWEPTIHIDVGTDLVVRGANVGRLQELGVGASGQYPLPQPGPVGTPRQGQGYRNEFLRPALREEFGR